MERSLLASSRSCDRCAHGNHGQCLHHPAADGSSWVEDPDTGKRRLTLFEGGVFSYQGRGAEIPRPPCQCEAADHIGEPGTCSVYTTNYNDRCGRPAKGIVPRGNRYETTYEVEACGLHLAAFKRKKANDAKWKAQNEARREKDQLIRSNSKASEMWAEKLQTEFGLPAETLHNSTKLRVKLSPEEAYKILDGVRSMLDDVYEDHPFRFGTIADV